ncbi:hypothetical protein OROGR_004649 [Orobanche gracilis]
MEILGGRVGADSDIGGEVGASTVIERGEIVHQSLDLNSDLWLDEDELDDSSIHGASRRQSIGNDAREIWDLARMLGFVVDEKDSGFRQLEEWEKRDIARNARGLGGAAEAVHQVYQL